MTTVNMIRTITSVNDYKYSVSKTKDKEEGKDKESIQLSITPDPFSTTTSPFLPNAK